MEKIFKIRASAAGQIMSNPLKKTDLLSKTSQTYVFDWLKEQIYGYRKEISNKYLTKGIELEDEAIDRAIEWLDLPMVLKNKDYFEDDFFCGTPDLIDNGIVYDIKNSWSCFTFPLFENEIPTKDYIYQLQVYMHLTGCKKAELVYVLLNTPESMIYETKHNYDNLDKKYRIKSFKIDYDIEIINDLQNRVTNIREFLKTIK